jgi:tetratricopeptide (TPR) repeat protein
MGFFLLGLLLYPFAKLSDPDVVDRINAWGEEKTRQRELLRKNATEKARQVVEAKVSEAQGPAPKKQIAIDTLPEVPARGVDLSSKQPPPSTLFRRSQRADTLEKEGQIDQAIALYQQNVDEFSEIPKDYMRLSIIYAKRDDLEKALEYCDLALISLAYATPPQIEARREFAERKQKLQARIAKKKEKEREKSE